MARQRRPNEGLFRLLAGAGAPSPTATGQAYSGITAGIESLHQVQRANLLTQGIKAGKINPQGLSVSDAGLLSSGLATIPAIKPKSDGGGGGLLGGIGGFFSNLLGEKGLAGTVEHLPQGIFTTAKDVAGLGLQASGITNDNPGAWNKLRKDVIDPTIEGYKYSYGPLFEGDFGKFAKHFYERPLGPVLDISSLASGGLGTAARVAGRVAPEGRLASLISREGRAPVKIQSHMSDRAVSQLGGGIPEIPRQFSTQPLAHIAQLTADRIVKGGIGSARLPGINKSLQDISQIRAINKWTDKTNAMRVLEGQMRARQASQGFVKSLNKMNPAEQTALHFALSGINDRALLSVAQDYWQKSLRGENPTGHNLEDFTGVPQQYVEHLANLPDHVVNLIEHPTQNMVDAANLWHAAVEEGRGELGIDPGIHAQNIVAKQRALSGKGDIPLTDEEVQRIISGDLSGYKPPPNEAGVEYPINPTYTPDMSAAGMKFGQERAGGLSFLARRLGISGKDYTLAPGERRITVTPTGPETVLRPPFQAYLKNSDLSTFHAGAFRTDAKSFVDHITRREEDLIDQIFNQNILDRTAIKDDHGEIRRLKSQAELDQLTGTKGAYTFLPVNGVFKFFRAETNVAKEAIKTIEQLQAQGAHGTQSMIDQLNRLLETHAKDFDRNILAAAKNTGVGVPTEFYKRMTAIAKSREPAFGHFYQRLINRWRTLTLAYMPRWWVNTGVGSAVLNIIKGVWNPRDYVDARRLMSSGKLPAGVQLGGFAEHEALEGPSGLLNARMPTRAIYHGVEKLESYFRTASFVSSLRKEERRAMRGIGDVLSSYKPIMKAGDEGHAAYIDSLLENPTLVEHALDDVNKFAYNMTELGPLERRYVRAFVPFWGWYKFITKLAWRLPVEFPGRTLAMTELGRIGMDQESQLGLIPDWMKGSLFLNHDKKNLAFLPTRGLNPFSQFANPFGAEGTVQGLLHWGQFSPVIQAAIQGAGIDTLTGGPTEISPEEGVGQDFWGNPIDLVNGKILSNVGQKAGVRRTIASFMRSFPEYRIAEPFFTGGNPVYPESIPFIAPRPRAVDPQTRKKFTLLGTLGATSGFSPKSVDLNQMQQLQDKRIRYAGTAQRRQLRRNREKLQK